MDFLPYAKIFNTELEALEPFTDEEVGRLFRGMLRYMKTGEDPGLKGNERFAWGLERNQLNAQHDAYQDKVDSMLSARAKRSTSNQVEVYKESTSNLVEDYKTSGEEKRREEKGREEKGSDEEEKGSNTAGKPAKHKYGEYQHVLLTDEEREKLADEYGEETLTKCIRKLDEYIEETGKRYKSHYLTIRRWVVDAVRRDAPKRGSNIFLDMMEDEGT